MQLVEWQGSSGIWFCADTSDLGHGSAEWWRLPRHLRIPLDEFVRILVEDYKCDKLKFNIKHNFLYYGWSKQSDMRKFKNQMNAKLRVIKR